MTTTPTIKQKIEELLKRDEVKVYSVLPAIHKIPGDQGHCFDTYQPGMPQAVELKYVQKLEQLVRLLPELSEALEFICMPFTSGEPTESHKNDMDKAADALTKLKTTLGEVAE